MPKIELLYFAACPNYAPTHEMLRRLLEAEGIAADVELVAVETEEEAKRQGFYGSPTVRIGGVDVVSPERGAAPALACRVYRAAQGHLTPIPPPEAIVAALRRTNL